MICFDVTRMMERLPRNDRTFQVGELRECYPPANEQNVEKPQVIDHVLEETMTFSHLC